MANELKGKTVVVTGGASGIGFEIADRFLEKEAKIVVILDINEIQGQTAVSTLNSKHGNGKSVFIKCDVTADLEAVSKKIFDTYRQVDVLVNNAGCLDSPKKTVDVNVTAVVEWSLRLWNHMRKDQGGNGGTIINLASIYGYRVTPFFPVYHASKFAVMGFTRSLGYPYNFDRSGVRVVAIAPGFTATSMTATSKVFDALDDQVQKDFDKMIKEQEWQEVGAVGNAAVDVFGRAESGTAWVIEGSKPIEELKLN